MQHLEKDHVAEKHNKKIKEIPKNNYQLSIFEPADPRLEELKEKLSLIDVNTLSPIEALLKLNEFQKLVKK
jgi:DNA mismatch repair protein MutS